LLTVVVLEHWFDGWRIALVVSEHCFDHVKTLLSLC
jgi:hypothetical protein